MSIRWCRLTPPPDLVPALCAALQLEHDELACDGFIDAVFEAMWQRAGDIGAHDILTHCLGKASLDPALADRACAGAHGDELVARTQAAYAAGVFGVPTFVANGEIFFGADRMDMLAWQLRRAAVFA